MEGTRQPEVSLHTQPSSAVSVIAWQPRSTPPEQPVLASETVTCQPSGFFSQPMPMIEMGTSQLHSSLSNRQISGIQPLSTTDTSTWQLKMLSTPAAQTATYQLPILPYPPLLPATKLPTNLRLMQPFTGTRQSLCNLLAPSNHSWHLSKRD